MTAYRFCRTDDMPLLVEAWECCRGPEDLDAPPLDRAGLKDLIREQDLWCSSCMVALEGREPVGVLLGAKRPQATLVYGLRVRPAHRRRGHARHLLTSLGQKLAILGPPRLLAEVPAERPTARAVFAACGWQVESTLVDWRRDDHGSPARSASPLPIAPIGLADLNGGFSAHGSRPWQRDAVALAKAAEDLRGLGVHSPEGLEAWILYRGPEILVAGFAAGKLGRTGLRFLVEELAARVHGEALLFRRAAPAEIDAALLADLGFRSGPEHLLYATVAKAA